MRPIVARGMHRRSGRIRRIVASGPRICAAACPGTSKRRLLLSYLIALLAHTGRYPFEREQYSRQRGVRLRKPRPWRTRSSRRLAHAHGSRRVWIPPIESGSRGGTNRLVDSPNCSVDGIAHAALLVAEAIDDAMDFAHDDCEHRAALRLLGFQGLIPNSSSPNGIATRRNAIEASIANGKIKNRNATPLTLDRESAS